eukprot:scaffold19614_cov101-Isochrysis_galbana.AAC.3
MKAIKGVAARYAGATMSARLRGACAIAYWAGASPSAGVASSASSASGAAGSASAAAAGSGSASGSASAAG